MKTFAILVIWILSLHNGEIRKTHEEWNFPAPASAECLPEARRIQDLMKADPSVLLYTIECREQ